MEASAHQTEGVNCRPLQVKASTAISSETVKVSIIGGVYRMGDRKPPGNEYCRVAQLFHLCRPPKTAAPLPETKARVQREFPGPLQDLGIQVRDDDLNSDEDPSRPRFYFLFTLRTSVYRS